MDLSGIITGATAAIDVLTTARPLSGVVTAGLQNAANVASQLVPRAEDRRAFFAFLEVERQLLKALNPLFEKEGLRLAGAQRSSRWNENYQYTAVYHDNQIHAALLQLPSDALTSDDESVIGQFLMLLKAFKGVRVRWLAQNESALTFAYQEAVREEDKGEDWQFVVWRDIQNTIGGAQKFGVLKIFQVSAPPASGSGGAKTLTKEQLQPVMDILAKLAPDTPGGPAGFFDGIVKKSRWPEPWKQQQGGRSSNAIKEASDIVNYAVGQGTFPAGHDKAGQSVLGWLLCDFVNEDTAGGGAQSMLSRFIIDNGLLKDEAVINALRKKIL